MEPREVTVVQVGLRISTEVTNVLLSMYVLLETGFSNRKRLAKQRVVSLTASDVEGGQDKKLFIVYLNYYR